MSEQFLVSQHVLLNKGRQKAFYETVQLICRRLPRRRQGAGEGHARQRWPPGTSVMKTLFSVNDAFGQGILKGDIYHCTFDLLFDWFLISCMTIEIFCFYLQNRLIQTSQTGGQPYSDTPPFSIPCFGNLS